MLLWVRIFVQHRSSFRLPSVILITCLFHRRLQDPHEKDSINCDAYLEQVFGCSRMRFAEIPSRLIQLQQDPDPIVINHLIVNDPEEPNKTACYDIEVEVVRSFSLYFA